MARTLAQHIYFARTLLPALPAHLYRVGHHYVLSIWYDPEHQWYTAAYSRSAKTTDLLDLLYYAHGISAYHASANLHSYLVSLQLLPPIKS